MSIHRKIEHIAAKIRDLARMIDRSVGKDEISEYSGGDIACKELPEAQQQELGVMILKMQDDELEQKGFSKLESWLVDDRRALRFYIEFTRMCANLRTMFGQTREHEEQPMAGTHQ
jgi:hypothetical protein